ncbi:putative secreted protein [Lactobacillus acidophilus]|nr:LPXTG-domain-containing protein cell wall anchor domain [Lactobacillus crispatus MV-1A-US]MBI1711518.1 LPXTG-motif cell wall anchor domain protein [Lactobacillus crispatus]STX16810.1 putative secreted protein [Lactobacillus acidophilus]
MHMMGPPYLGGNHDFHFNNFIIKNKTGVDGLESKDLKDPKAQIPIIYDTLGDRKFNSEANSKGVFSSDNFNQAMEFKSQGDASNVFIDRSQYSSYVISFTTQHTDSHEVELFSGPKNQQFSGISANIYSYQNGHYNMFSRLYGEQRALDAAGAVVKAKDMIPGWVDANIATAKIHTDYLNNAQIYALRYKIQNNVTDSNALNNIITEGNSLNDAMKKLGNSIGQYDSDGSFADHKEDTTKESDRYKYANPDKKAAYDNATEVTKALINKDTGAYADQATVEKLTEAENKAWNELKVVLANKITPTVPATKEPVADTSHLTKDEQDKVQKNVEDANKGNFPEGTTVTVGSDGTATVTYPDQSTDTIKGSDLVRPTEDKDNYDPHGPKNPDDRVPVKDQDHLTDGEKNDVKDEIGKENPDLPKGTEVDVDDKGNATIKYPDGSKDTIPGDQLVQGQKGDTTDAGNITPTVPGDKVTVKDPSHLTDDEKNQVKNNVDNVNKDKFPAGTGITVGDDGTTTVTYPDGTKDTIPGDQLVQGQKGDTTDAGNITPTIPGGKVTVKDPSHLTDDEKNQVKNNVDNANKDKFPAGTEVTVGDDGTTTVTYPDGSKDVIAGTDLVIAAKSEDVPGSKHHSHKNGSNSSQVDGVKGASTANGSIANAGNNLGVKGERDNAIGNNKATSLKTLPQTGTKDTSILGVLGMLLASLGLFVFKKKRDEK